MQNFLEHGKSAAADFDPANYRFVASGYNWDCGEEYADYISAVMSDLDEHQHAAIWAAMNQDPYSGLNKPQCGGKCLHCGKYLHWFVLFQDIRTGLYITTGTTCAEELHLDDRGALIRKKIGERVERSRKLAKIDARYPGLRQELERVSQEGNRHRAYFHKLLDDMVYKINRYLDLSDRQAAVCKRFLSEGLDKIEQWDAERAAQKANEPAPSPAPTGRVTVTGKVLTVKEYEVEDPWGSRYGDGMKTIYKMLVQDDRGFKVWGSLPSNISGAQRGDRVTFAAALEPKTDDPTFAFYKRPTKASVIRDEEPVA